MNIIFRVLHHFVDFFYPPICLVCGDKINLDYKSAKNPHIVSTEFCCAKCKSRITFVENINKTIIDIIPNYDPDDFAITNAISLFKNTIDPPIINLIYALKYRGYTRIGLEYGQWLGEVLISEKMTDYDYIVPVPIHSARKRERGFNQSDLIAQGINKILKIKIAFDLLKKTKYTFSQTSLSISERLQNLKNIFVFNEKYNVTGKKILLVDDVITTGSTLNNCALVLLENKAQQVDVATLLKA